MVRSETVAQSPAGQAARDDAATADALRAAVGRVRRDLAAHPAELPDRVTAEEELAVLEGMAVRGAPEVVRLRGSLLLVAGALGSVSALAASVAELRLAVDRFAGRPAAPGD